MTIEVFGIIVLMVIAGFCIWCVKSGEKDLEETDDTFNKFMEWAKENPEAFKEWYEREML